MPRLSGQLIPAAAAIVLLAIWAVVEMQGTSTSSAEPQKQSQPRADRAPAPPPAHPVPFDGKRALEYIRDLCKIGTRISGSDGMKKQRDLVKAHFEKYGGKVSFQRFTAQQTSRPNPVEMANVIVAWHPDRARRVILCTHYDTRPKADQERDPRRWNEPFLSANDGTSGVAWLMELAHHMKELPTEVGVDFVLFDGEEFVFDGPHGQDRYFFGSDHFADEYKRTPPKYRYAGAVLLDLIAGKDAKYPIEQNSNFKAGKLVEEIWRTAREVGVGAFRNSITEPILDDHLALNRVGIPAVDIIDFDYPHWHKLSDLPENCSAESMEQLAKVLTTWLQRVN
jgi:hypothetical protein